MAINDCPACNESGVVTWKQTTQAMPYGASPNTVVLSVEVWVGTCSECDFVFTDYRAEEARAAAVRKHLEKN
jgi:C4-type Zn-finger protein